MQCNIDARGRAVRLISGATTVAIGLVLVGLGLLAGVAESWLPWAGGGLVAAGGFAVFEARAGWCAVRAMGFKTRI